MTTAENPVPLGQAGTGGAFIWDSRPFYNRQAQDQFRRQTQLANQEARDAAAKQKAALEAQKRADDYAKGVKFETNPTTFLSDVQTENDTFKNQYMFQNVQKALKDRTGFDPLVIGQKIQQGDNLSKSEQVLFNDVGTRIKDNSKILKEQFWDVKPEMVGAFENTKSDQIRQKTQNVQDPYERYAISMQEVSGADTDFAKTIKSDLRNYNYAGLGNEILKSTGKTETTKTLGGGATEIISTQNIVKYDPKTGQSKINLEVAEKSLRQNADWAEVYDRTVEEQRAIVETDPVFKNDSNEQKAFMARAMAVQKYFPGKGNVDYKLTVKEGSGSGSDKKESAVLYQEKKIVSGSNEFTVDGYLFTPTKSSEMKQMFVPANTELTQLNSNGGNISYKENVMARQPYLTSIIEAKGKMNIDGVDYKKGDAIPPTKAPQLSRNSVKVKVGFAFVPTGVDKLTVVDYEFARQQGKQVVVGKTTKTTSGQDVNEIGEVFVEIGKAANIAADFRASMGEKKFDIATMQLKGKFQFKKNTRNAEYTTQGGTTQGGTTKPKGKYAINNL
jgi:hypothetical protein